jgi:hypothetical protein
VACVCKWPDYKAMSQATFEELVGVCKQTRNAEPRRQVSLGQVPKVFREPIRGFHELLRQEPPSLLIL